MIKIRASSLGKIMSEPKDKTKVLAKGAETFLNQLASEYVLNYYKVIDTKPMKKGKECEQDSIDLFNHVNFTDYVKNTERKENEFLTGECDIFTGDTIIDIKTSWDKSTFPLMPDEGQNDDYEWQLRAYMMLWGVKKATLAYCLVDTPEALIGYDQPDLHDVSRIDSALRVTQIHYEWDEDKEEKIKQKCLAAQEYIINRINSIKQYHGV